MRKGDTTMLTTCTTNGNRQNGFSFFLIPWQNWFNQACQMLIEIFRLLFRSYLDDTPVHYLLRYRLQEAAKQLITTEKKITVIAQSSGFENAEYFCKSFKKHYHMTPTEYRRKKQLSVSRLTASKM